MVSPGPDERHPRCRRACRPSAGHHERKRFGQGNAARRRNQRAEGAVESPFAGKLARPCRPQPLVGRERAAFELRQRSGCCELSTPEGEPQSIASDRVDEARRISSQQEAGASCRDRIDGQRPECGDGRNLPRPREALPQPCVAGHRVADDFVAPRPMRPRTLQLAHDADIRNAADQRSDACVSVDTDVHFSASGQTLDVRKIGAERPTFRTRRKSRQSQHGRKLRVPSVCGDHEPRLDFSTSTALLNAHAVDASAIGSNRGRDNIHRGREVGAGRDCRIEQQQVEVAPLDRGSSDPTRVVGGDRRASRSCDDHAGERARMRTNGRTDAKPVEDGQCAGVHRIAAKLGTWKAGSVDEPDADAGARKNQCRHAARGTRADDEHARGRRRTRPARRRPRSLLHKARDKSHCTRPSTSALFFDPNPRQLHSAASTSALRATLGMKSMSHAGS